MTPEDLQRLLGYFQDCFKIDAERAARYVAEKFEYLYRVNNLFLFFSQKYLLTSLLLKVYIPHWNEAHVVDSLCYYLWMAVHCDWMAKIIGQTIEQVNQPSIKVVNGIHIDDEMIEFILDHSPIQKIHLQVYSVFPFLVFPC